MQNNQIFELFGKSVAAAKLKTLPKVVKSKKTRTKKSKTSNDDEWDSFKTAWNFDPNSVNVIDLQMQELSNDSVREIIATDEFSNDADISFHSIGSMLTEPEPIVDLMNLPRIYPCRVEKEEWMASANSVADLKHPEAGTVFPCAHIPLVIKPDTTRENGLICEFVLCEAYFDSN
jgi:hypothetical protein